MEEAQPNILAQEKGDLIVIELGGVINASTLMQSQEQIDQIIKNHDINKRNGLKILIDYKRVQDVDSSTVASILEQLMDHQKQQHTIAFVNVSERLKTIINLHNLQGTIKIYNNKEEALQELQKPKQ